MEGIYKITNKLNNKVYIGSTVNLKNREQRHFKNLKDGTHHSKKLQNAYFKYVENFFLFEAIESYDKIENDLLIEREQYWINFYDSYKKGYNSRPKAENNYGHKHSEETKKILSEKNAGKNNAMYGVKRTEEQKSKQRDLFINKSYEERYGYEKAKKIKEKKRIIALNRKHTEKTKLKQSRIKKSKPILQLDDQFNVIKEWYSKREPLRDLGIRVDYVVRGKNKYSCGFYWVYKNEYELFLSQRRN